jgi:hypothetical protein
MYERIAMDLPDTLPLKGASVLLLFGGKPEFLPVQY